MTEEITWKQFKEAIEAGDLDKLEKAREYSCDPFGFTSWKQSTDRLE